MVVFLGESVKQKKDDVDASDSPRVSREEQLGESTGDDSEERVSVNFYCCRCYIGSALCLILAIFF